MSITQMREENLDVVQRGDRRTVIDPVKASASDLLVRPALLVSVRNAAEARCAIEGGCDIIDVKEPARGALGRADSADIEAIIALCRERNVGLPVSVALGEATDRDEGDRIEPFDMAGGRDEVAFFKLGTAGLGKMTHWWKTLREARHRWEAGLIFGSNLQRAQWVAVAYADWSVARSPSPRDVLAAADDAGWSGILVDTFDKTGGGLFAWQSDDALRELAAESRRRGLWFALAGRLSIADLPRVARLAPDVAGIRTAACRGHDRNGAIDPACVRSAVEQLGRGGPARFLSEESRELSPPALTLCGQVHQKD